MAETEASINELISTISDTIQPLMGDVEPADGDERRKVAVLSGLRLLRSLLVDVNRIANALEEKL